jgi:hypothetical protein
MYDIEAWQYTPPAEQAAPFRSMRWFVAAARGYGFVAVLAPAGALWRDRGAYRDADVYLAQVQNILDPARYRAKVCMIVERFGGPVYAELSANNRPGHDATGLMRQWRAGQACTSRFAVWGWDPAHVMVLQDFLTRASV